MCGNLLIDSLLLTVMICIMSPIIVIILVTTGEVAVTMDTTTELSGTDEEDKRGQSDYH